MFDFKGFTVLQTADFIIGNSILTHEKGYEGEKYLSMEIYSYKDCLELELSATPVSPLGVISIKINKNSVY